MRIPCDAVAATAALGSLVPRGLQNGPTLHMDDRELAMYFLQLTRTLIGDFCAQRGCVCVCLIFRTVLPDACMTWIGFSTWKIT